MKAPTNISLIGGWMHYGVTKAIEVFFEGLIIPLSNVENICSLWEFLQHLTQTARGRKEVTIWNTIKPL